MIKLIVFDLDNTLAEHGKGIAASDVEKLKKLEKKGINIAICSGKPVHYLSGFMRQVGLNKPFLLGENGAVLQVDVKLPPKELHIIPTGVDKGVGVRLLAQQLHLKPEEIVAVGDGENDYPMFKYAGTALGVNVKEEGKVDKNFATITEVLDYLDAKPQSDDWYTLALEDMEEFIESQGIYLRQ